MRCSRFGSSSGNITIVSKKYVDSKYITLIKDLQTKVNKTGDVLEGELNMNNNKITNVASPSNNSDVANKLYVDNKIEESENDLSEMVHAKVNKSGDMIRGTIDMNHNRIINLGNPLNGTEAVNKDYVDTEIRNVDTSKINKTDLAQEIRKLQLYTLSEEGLIPNISKPNDKSGWVVSSSHPTTTTDVRTYYDYKLFDYGIWKVLTESAMNSWIGVRNTNPVRIYQFRIKPVENVIIKKWKIQGKLTDEWENLLFDLIPIDHYVTRTFTLQNPLVAKPYYSYRILIEEFEGENPGLIYWQMYAMSPVYIT